MLQLNPPIALDTPEGKALAYALIDPGFEHDLQWVCFMKETRECWTFRNSEVRYPENYTLGIVKTKCEHLHMYSYPKFDGFMHRCADCEYWFMASSEKPFSASHTQASGDAQQE